MIRSLVRFYRRSVIALFSRVVTFQPSRKSIKPKNLVLR